MAASYALWQAELKQPVPPEDRQHRSTDRLMLSGFWRMEGARTRTDWPVAIWTLEGKEDLGTIFQIGNKQQNTTDNADEWADFTQKGWLWCSAVTKADWSRAIETGFWSDGKPAKAMTAEEKLGIDMPAGDNNAPLDESLADQINNLVDKAKALEVKDQPSADAASGILDKLRALLKSATAAFETEKLPWLEGGRKVDAKWATIREPGKEAGVSLGDRRDKWLKAEQARLDKIAADENRKRQAEVDRLAEIERERLRKEAEQHGQQVDEREIEQRVAETVAPVQEVVAPKAKASSDFGRGTTAKKVKRAVVTDPVSLVQHFFDVKDEDFDAYLDQRAQKAMRAKITLPGVKIEES